MSTRTVGVELDSFKLILLVKGSQATSVRWDSHSNQKDPTVQVYKTRNSRLFVFEGGGGIFTYMFVLKRGRIYPGRNQNHGFC